jgi:hypothetical protein
MKFSTSLAGRTLLPGRFLVLICVRGWVDPRAVVRLEGLGQLENPVTIENRTRDIPACSIVPQPTTLPRSPTISKMVILLFLLRFVRLLPLWQDCLTTYDSSFALQWRRCLLFAQGTCMCLQPRYIAVRFIWSRHWMDGNAGSRRLGNYFDSAHSVDGIIIQTHFSHLARYMEIIHYTFYMYLANPLMFIQPTFILYESILR